VGGKNTWHTETKQKKNKKSQTYTILFFQLVTQNTLYFVYASPLGSGDRPTSICGCRPSVTHRHGIILIVHQRYNRSTVY